METKLLHKIPHVMRTLDQSRPTIYRLISRGELQLVHIGRSALVTDESLRDYVERLKATARANVVSGN